MNNSLSEEKLQILLTQSLLSYKGRDSSKPLGSQKNPAIVRVRSQEMAKTILDICNDYGWQVMIGIEHDKPEDLDDLGKLFESRLQVRSNPKTGRNEPCPCGSNIKYKKCCMNQSPSPFG